MEIWKKIKDYNNLCEVSDLYEVSNLGRYRNSTQRRGGYKKHTVLKPKIMRDGYLMMRLTDKNGFQTNKSLHRAVAECFIGNPDQKPQVNHKDFDKQNNKVSNLEWVTPKENIAHAVKGGRMVGPYSHKESYSERRKSFLAKKGYPVFHGMTSTKSGKSDYMKLYHQEKTRSK